MRKLKLESLQVESFDTTATAPRLRGTVAGHQDTDMSYCEICQGSYDHPCGLETYDVVVCGETRYFDCSLGCPSIAPCEFTEYTCA
jgi:hypothetical protein